jgi:hypothetical protein
MAGDPGLAKAGELTDVGVKWAGHAQSREGRVSSTGLKSLAGLTRARHRGNVAPSNTNYSKRPLAPRRSFANLDRLRATAPAAHGMRQSRRHSLGVNRTVSNDSLTEWLHLS